MNNKDKEKEKEKEKEKDVELGELPAPKVPHDQPSGSSGFAPARQNPPAAWPAFQFKREKVVGRAETRGETPRENKTHKKQQDLALRSEIRDLIADEYLRDVRQLMQHRTSWRHTSEVCETLSKILAGGASIMSFSASVYKYTSLSFTAGCMGTVAITLLLFANYSARESSERTWQLNSVLGALGVTTVPDIAKTDTNMAIDSQGTV